MLKTFLLSDIHSVTLSSLNLKVPFFVQILARASKMTDFKMVSSRVGPDGGNALLKALRAGRNSSLRLNSLLKMFPVICVFEQDFMKVIVLSRFLINLKIFH